MTVTNSRAKILGDFKFVFYEEDKSRITVIVYKQNEQLRYEKLKEVPERQLYLQLQNTAQLVQGTALQTEVFSSLEPKAKRDVMRTLQNRSIFPNIFGDTPTIAIGALRINLF